jgi:4-hydroxy-3-methylbut-2-en-1-yl diphosphate synthase IspG/GcpE
MSKRIAIPVLHSENLSHVACHAGRISSRDSITWCRREGDEQRLTPRIALRESRNEKAPRMRLARDVKLHSKNWVMRVESRTRSNKVRASGICLQHGDESAPGCAPVHGFSPQLKATPSRVVSLRAETSRQFLPSIGSCQSACARVNIAVFAVIQRRAAQCGVKLQFASIGGAVNRPGFALDNQIELQHQKGTKML